MADTLTLAELKALIGKEIGVSRWFTLDQAKIDAFADLTEDHQFIHIDPVAAAKTPFGSTIAHGFLTLSMLSAMAYDVLPDIKGRAMGVNYGFDRIRFLSPVRAGRRIRGRFTLTEIIERGPHEFMAKHSVSVEIEGESKPALAAEWMGISYLTP